MMPDEKALRELLDSEERLRAFMRHSPVLAFMKDSAGRYVYVNARMEETFAIRLSDIAGKADVDWLPESIARVVRENDRRVLSTGQVVEVIESVPTAEDGIQHWMVVKFPFTQADGRQFVGGVAMDITARLEMEDALQRKEQEVRSLLDNTPDIVVRFDRQLRHVFVNRAGARLRGMAAEDVVGKTLAELDVPADQRRVLEGQMRQVLDTGRVSTFEGTFAISGSPAHHRVQIIPEPDPAGAIHSVLVISRDITRLKQAETRLLASERRYRRLFEDSLGLVCTHDLEGRLLSLNEAAARSLGYEPSELLGANLRDHLVAEVRPQFDRYLERVAQRGTDEGLMLVLAKDGRVRAWKYRNAFISEPGTDDYVLGHAQDVTELKQAQEDARHLSLTDDLTGLYNRRGFFALAEQHLKLARAPRSRKGALLVYADMDGLKAVNDRYGHDQGSLAIVRVADVMRRTFRDSDILARLGGDEFVALTIAAAGSDEATIRARLTACLADDNALGHHPYTLALSVGIAAVDSARPRSLEELLKEADAAMYEEKRRKKERAG